MVLQETFVLYDTIFYDKAVTGNKKEWINLNNNIIETVTDDYTLLKSTVSSSNNRYTTPSTLTFPSSFVVEFNKHNTVESGTYIILGSRNIHLASAFNGALADANNIKFICDNGVITTIHDGVTETTTYEYTSLDYIRFQFNNTDLELKYSDFKIYSI